jgi:isopentenyldiphosphate isomerase
MKTELKYRTFEELLDSVKIDLRSFDLEGMIDDQTLIKVVQRVNYDLGLKINPNHTKMLEVHNYRAKLPSDFYVLNHALLCTGSVDTYVPPLWSYKTYQQGVADGIYQAEFEIYKKMVEQYTQILTINPGLNTITHNLGTNYVIVQALAQDHTLLNLDVIIIDDDTIQLDSSYAQPYHGVIVTVMGSKASNGQYCPPDPCPIPPNPCVQDAAPCNSTCVTHEHGQPVVIDRCNGRTRKFKNMFRLEIVKNNSVSADCVDVNSRNHYAVFLKNGFIETNFKEGEVLIMYESVMETAKGELMVLSHPYADEYYEYAIKERIYENLAQAGENTFQLMQLMTAKLREARNKALGFINTPDFNEMKQIWLTNRKAQYYKFYDMFKNSMPHHPYYT